MYREIQGLFLLSDVSTRPCHLPSLLSPAVSAPMNGYSPLGHNYIAWITAAFDIVLGRNHYRARSGYISGDTVLYGGCGLSPEKAFIVPIRPDHRSSSGECDR